MGRRSAQSAAGFLAGQPAQKRGDMADGQTGLLDHRLESPLVGLHQRLQRGVVGLYSSEYGLGCGRCVGN